MELAREYISVLENLFNYLKIGIWNNKILFNYQYPPSRKDLISYLSTNNINTSYNNILLNVFDNTDI
jgi:hypothetical protein